MSRRLMLFGLLAASQLSTGCWCVRERIAACWRAHHPYAAGGGCAPACAPACATPAFRIPSPVIGNPVVGSAPVVVGGPIGGPPPGCSSCAGGGIEAAPVGYPVAVGGPGMVYPPPVIGTPMPLGAPRIEAPMPMPAGAPKN